MTDIPISRSLSLGTPFSSDPGALQRFFGRTEGLLPLWLAEPYIPLAPSVIQAVQDRAAEAWLGYESRPADVLDAFWSWMSRRHHGVKDGLRAMASPSVGTSIAVLIDLYSEAGDGVILQPPVYTGFKPLVRGTRRTPVRNPLCLRDGRYGMDIDGLRALAANPKNSFMLLCNPHNPVGRAWTREELRQVAEVCAEGGVFVLADEIHGDLVLPPHQFTPFAKAAEGTDVKWASTHGPIKTFGVAGIADTLLVTGDAEIAVAFQAVCQRLHLKRNNVFSLAATRAGYRDGDAWLDDFLQRIRENAERLEAGLPGGVALMPIEATYLAWLDFRELGMEAPELASWLVSEAGLALSPGHWFGREGAGFARMTIAVEEHVLVDAIGRLRSAVDSL